MVLADTSVWVAHFRSGDPLLSDLLNRGEVFTHPFVSGEIACGNLKNRTIVLKNFSMLPQIEVATHEEVLSLVEDRMLWGSGIGWIDSHLLASAFIARCSLWTVDKRLHTVAKRLNIAA